MSYSAILTRLAIESYWQTKLNPDAAGKWGYIAMYKATAMLTGCDTEYPVASPASYCMCLHCGNVIPHNLPSRHLFVTCCQRCFDELPSKDKALALHHGASCRMSGADGIAAALSSTVVYLFDFDAYLKRIWLTGTNPFETIIEDYKSRLT